MAFDVNISIMLQFLNVPRKFNFSLDEFLQVSQDFENDNHWFSRTDEITIIASFSFLIVFGLISNGLVFYIISRKGCRQSSRNWYILNLTGSDILTSTVCKPLTIVRIVLKNWDLGETLCKMVPFLHTVYVFVSTFTLVALAVDRYSAIIYNNHQARFRRSVYACITSIWAVSIAIAVPMVIVHDIEHVRGYNGNIIYSLCLEKWETATAVRTYACLMLLLQYLSPLISIIVLHLLIGRFLRSRLANNLSDNANIQQKRKRHRKNILLLSCMAVSFGVAWFPLNLINTMAMIDHSVFEGTNFPLLYAVSLIIAFSSVCLNPVIYGLLNTNFRRDLMKMCRGHPLRYSIYTDFTRRSSPNPEALGLITTTPHEITLTRATNILRVRNGNCISAL